ncbi:MAG: extracellular solute-binding protein [Clostridiales bacterium]|nr:extracellular solute-binding protein [Clostridiales bacterium]
MRMLSRRAMAVILSSSMILPLTACNNSKKKNSSVRQNVVKEDDPYFDVKKASVSIPIDPDKEVTYQNVNNLTFLGDMVMISYSIDYKIPPEVEKQIENLNWDDETGDACQKMMELTEKYSESGTIYYDLDGNMIKKESSQDSENISGVFPQKDGSFLKTATVYENGECVTKTKLYDCDSQGNVQNEIILEDTEEMWQSTVFRLDNGNYLVGAGMNLSLVGKDGKLIHRDQVEGFYGTILFTDGKYYASTDKFDEKTGETTSAYCEVDPESGTLKGSPIEVASSYWEYIQGADKCYLMDVDGIKSVDPIKGDKETILDWNWTDYNEETAGSRSVVIKSDDEIILLEELWNNDLDSKGISEYSIVKLTRQEKNPHAGKTIIQIGTMYDDSQAEFRNYIIQYNLDPNHLSRIFVKSYGSDIEANSDDELQKLYDELPDKIYLDMIAGEGPDILMNFSRYSQFNSEKVLVDLNQFIDGQSGLKRDEYFDNIFRAFETKGKMYQVPLCIDISGYVSSSDIVGNRSGWTYEEFENVIKSLPDNVSVFDDGVSSSQLLDEMLSVASDSFIDYEKGTVSFDTAEFRELLEISKKYANSHPVSENGEMGGYYGVTESGAIYSPDIVGMPEDSYLDPLDRIAEKMLVLSPTSLYSLEDIARVKKSLKGKEVFLGIPSPNGSGMSALPMMTFGISAKSKHIDEAWDFIRFMFSEDAQFSYADEFNSIPINRAALDRRNKAEIEFVQKWNNQFEGKTEEDSVDLSKIGLMDALTEDDAKTFVSLVENVSTFSSFDPGIMEIIKEESAGYYSGQRSAEDVSKIIQNKATTKVHER